MFSCSPGDISRCSALVAVSPKNLLQMPLDESYPARLSLTHPKQGNTKDKLNLCTTYTCFRFTTAFAGTQSMFFSPKHQP